MPSLVALVQSQLRKPTARQLLFHDLVFELLLLAPFCSSSGPDTAGLGPWFCCLLTWYDVIFLV